jgi:hypothetical protein
MQTGLQKRTQRILSGLFVVGVASASVACGGTPSGGTPSEGAQRSSDTASNERVGRTETATTGAVTQAVHAKTASPSPEELSDHEEVTVHPSTGGGK